MELAKQHFFTKVSFTVFSYYGHFPHRSRLSCIIVTSSFALSLAVALLCQVIKLFEEDLDTFLVFDILPALMTTLTLLLTSLISASDRKKHHEIFLMIEADWHRPRTEEESKIKKKLIKDMQAFVTMFTLFLYGATFTAISADFVSQLLYDLGSHNETKPRRFLIPAEYFIDEEEYLTYVLVFQYWACLISCTYVTALENIFIACVFYVCFMFTETGYNLENLMAHTKGIRNRKCENLLAAKIKSYVQLHQTAIHCTANINTVSKWYLLLSLVVTVSGLSFLLAEVKSTEMNPVRSLCFISCMLGHFFILSILGQRLMDTCTELSQKVYNAEWYNCPPKFRKILVIILLRTHRLSTIVIGFLFILSLDNFCSVLKTAVSYCMVLNRFQ